jgi:uncharacterized protein (DUF433 family)
MSAPQLDRIVHNPQILGGKASIRGTRIGVAFILEKMAWGETVDSILTNYPHLKLEDIQAALAYAHGAVETEIPLVAAE